MARRPPDMSKRPIRAREDWGELGIDPEVRSAYRRYGGRSRDEALPLFAASPIERAAELRFAPTAVFNDDVFCFAAVLSSRAGAGAADAASCFVRLVRDRLRSDAAETQGHTAVRPERFDIFELEPHRFGPLVEDVPYPDVGAVDQPHPTSGHRSVLHGVRGGLRPSEKHHRPGSKRADVGQTERHADDGLEIVLHDGEQRQHGALAIEQAHPP